MRAEVAKTAGFCFGVRRAVDLAGQEAKKRPIYAYGELIHNSHEIRRLEQCGVHTASRTAHLCLSVRTAWQKRSMKDSGRKAVKFLTRLARLFPVSTALRSGKAGQGGWL